MRESPGHILARAAAAQYAGEMTQPSPIPSSLGGRLCLATSLTADEVQK